jgi:hypothetical protein
MVCPKKIRFSIKILIFTTLFSTPVQRNPREVVAVRVSGKEGRI